MCFVYFERRPSPTYFQLSNCNDISSKNHQKLLIPQVVSNPRADTAALRIMCKGRALIVSRQPLTGWLHSNHFLGFLVDKSEKYNLV